MPIDMNKLKEAYLSEAKSHIKMMDLALIELEKNPDNGNVLAEIYRAAHTLKSLAGTMNFNQSMNVCHTMEDLLSSVKNKTLHIFDCIDVLFEAVDFLAKTNTEVKHNRPELNADSLILKLNESFQKKSISNHHALPEKVIAKAHEKLEAIDVKVERLDNLMNLTEELLVNKMHLDAIESEIANSELTTAVELLGSLITELQFQVMQIRMVPINFIFSRFHRLVRDLAKVQHKEIVLDILEGDIELDRSLIDELAESLTHLIKNSIDHGLETPKERRELGKPEVGTIQLSAIRTKEVIQIEVSDDGRGLDLKSLRQRGLQNHLLKENASDEEVLQVIFKEISTKKNVTSVSGRGLGLDIVKQKIESIGGHIGVKTKMNKGTTFFIEIPLTLAIIKVLFVKVNSQLYAIPIENVERLLMVDKENFKGLLNQEAIIHADQEIPIVWLSKLFGDDIVRAEKQPVVIIEKDSNRLGLAVDALCSTEEIVIKPLSAAIRSINFFSGAALVGSGQMVLILDVLSLFSYKLAVTEV